MRSLSTILFLPLMSLPSASFAGTWGEQAAKNALAMLSFTEMQNLLSADSICVGQQVAPRPSTKIIDEDLIPELNRLSSNDARAGVGGVQSLTNEFRSFAKTIETPGNALRLSITKVYEQKKKEATIAYGERNACIALSVTFKTIVHQNLLQLKNTR